MGSDSVDPRKLEDLIQNVDRRVDESQGSIASALEGLQLSLQKTDKEVQFLKHAANAQTQQGAHAAGEVLDSARFANQKCPKPSEMPGPEISSRVVPTSAAVLPADDSQAAFRSTRERGQG